MKNWRWLIRFLLFSCIISFSVSAQHIIPKPKRSIHIFGSDTYLYITQLIAEAYMKENQNTIVIVNGSGSYHGMLRLISGTSDIGLASDYDENFADLTSDNQLKLVPHVISYNAIIPIIHLDNSVTNLTMEQLRYIFLGKSDSWKQVGGLDAPIEIFSFDKFSGTHSIWLKQVLKKTGVITPKAHILSPSKMVNAIANNKNAIGYVEMNMLNQTDRIKVISVNGVSATGKTIKDGSYPVPSKMIFYTTESASDQINDFIKFAQDPTKGQQIIKNNSNLITLFEKNSK